ncbi:ComEC/Rec2 family competence protein [Limisphaera sp. VF-2]|jgi:competence protein ComEC|uniref:ComEC/Rec2 family competence protein n=1 Tax=Limisphaera sp. VF-2 TaxID=3400418 RepID=UPI001761747B
MRRPAVGLALAYATGVWLADRVEPSLTWLWVAALGLWGVCWLWREGRAWLLPLFVGVLGALNLTQRTVPLAPHDLRAVVGERVPVLTTLRGHLAETPTLRLRIAEGQEAYRTAAFVDVEAVRLGGEWQPAKGRVLALTPAALGQGFHGGQGVEVQGVLEFPPEAAAPGLLDYRAYLERRGVYYRLMVTSESDWRCWGEKVPEPWTDRFVAWATRQLQRGQPDDVAIRLLRAMTLGWRTALTDEVSEPFLRSGTMHVFAISGLHIALLSGMLVTGLRVLGIARPLCAWLVVPMIWFYTAATGWQPSAVRATIMTTVMVTGWALGRPGDLLNALALAAALILLWQPEQLFHAGFQLSFAVVASLALWLPKVDLWIQRWLQADPYVPAEARRGLRQKLAPAFRAVALAGGTSWAAWVGSLPLIAWHFHIVTPITLMANLVVVPCSSLALASCVGSWVCGGWAAPLAELFNHSAWLWMQLMLRASEWAAAVPGGSWFVKRPVALEVAGYYALCVWALTGGWKSARGRVGWAVVAAMWLGWLGWQRWEESREVRLTALPTSRAAVLWVEGPGREGTWLINCGRDEDVDFLVEPFLRAQGMNRVPALVLAHGSADSVGGAARLGERPGVNTVWIPATDARSKVYREVVRRLEETPGRVRSVTQGQAMGPWRVLHPDEKDRFTRAADGALVLLGRWHEVRVLWLGALGREGQERLLTRHDDLRAELLILGGASDPGRLPALLSRVKPEFVVVLDGRPGSPLRESDPVRTVLAQAPVPVWYSSREGAVQIRVAKSGWELRSMRGSHWQSPGHRESREAD